MTTPALEKMIPASFDKMYLSYRPTDVKHKVVSIADMTMAINATVHQFPTSNKDGVSLVPYIDVPYVTNERSLNVYADIINAFPHTGEFSIDPKLKIVFNPARYNAVTQGWFRSNPHIRRIMSRPVIYGQVSALPIVSYQLLSAAKFPTNQLTPIWRFESELKTVLDTVESMAQYGRRQLIHFYPDGPFTYALANRVKEHGRMSYDSVPVELKDSALYSTIPASLAKSIKIKPRMFLMYAHLAWYMMGDRRSLFTRLSDSAQHQLNIMFDFGISATYGHRACTFSLSQLRGFYEKDPSIINGLVRILNVTMIQQMDVPASADVGTDLSESQLDEVIHSHTDEVQQEHDATRDDIVKEVQAATDTGRSITETKFTTSSASTSPEHVSMIDKVEEYLYRQIEDKSITQKQADRLSAIGRVYQTLTIDGKSIGALLSAPPMAVPDKYLDFLEGKVVDKSMLHSTLMDYHKHYLRHMLHADIAKSLVAFAKQGLYLTDLQEVKVANAINQKVTYYAKFTDKDGVSHSITFSVPIIREDGSFYVNGIKTRMTNQMVNNPICKLSDTQVSLVSAYNKTMVERNIGKANSFRVHFVRLMNSIQTDLPGELVIREGSTEIHPHLPYEYTQIGCKYQDLIFANKKAHLKFGFKTRFQDINLPAEQSALEQLEQKHNAIFIGVWNTSPILMSSDTGRVLVLDKPHAPMSVTYLIHSILNISGYEPPPVEWCTLKLRNGVFPIVLLMGMQYGLSNVMKKYNVSAHVVPAGTTIKSVDTTDTYRIKFKDATMFIPRYPLHNMLFMGGLVKLDLSDIYLAEMDVKDTYYRIFQDNGFVTNYIKGADAFFDLFIDPITDATLRQLNLPTEMDDILMYCINLLTTEHHLQSSSIQNLRVRGYERVSAFLYASIAREYEVFNVNRHRKRSMSINPEDVFQKIVTDATTSGEEQVNPAQAIKDISMITYAGAGGRTAQSFVMRDREYPDDGVGVLSYNTPDSGKVAINAYLTANPNLSSMRGTFNVLDQKQDGSNLSRVLSHISLLIPGATRDDGKRENFISIQLQHQLPVHNARCSRIRTGYETVIAHHGPKVFAHPAEANGTVTKIDPKLGLISVLYDGVPLVPERTIKIPGITPSLKSQLSTVHRIDILLDPAQGKMLTENMLVSLEGQHLYRVVSVLIVTDIKHAPTFNNVAARKELGEITPLYHVRFDKESATTPPTEEVIAYGESFTTMSGEKHRQIVVPNVIEGERFNRGDILAYNSGFFEPDLDSKQVLWKHGLQAVVAITPFGITMEDSCAISPEFSHRSVVHPAAERIVSITAEQAISGMVKVGDIVDVPTPLCRFDDVSIYDENIDEATRTLMSSMDQKKPKSKYSGRVASIEVYYTGDPKVYHESVRKIIEQYNATQAARYNVAKSSLSRDNYIPPGPVPVGTKFKGIMFDEATVAIVFTITEHINSGQADKLIVNTASKCTIGQVYTKSPKTVSGTSVDVVFGANELFKRMVTSPFSIGGAQYCLMHAERRIKSLATKGWGAYATIAANLKK